MVVERAGQTSDFSSDLKKRDLANRQIVERLFARGIWQENFRGGCLVVDVLSNQKYTIDKKSGQLEYQAEGFERKRKFASLVLVSESFVKDIEIMRARLETLINTFKVQSLFVLEVKQGKLTNEEKIQRKDFLGEFGLVKKQILVKDKNFILWEGRVPKKAKRKPIDLTSHEPFWRKPWLDAKKIRRNREAIDNGLRILDDSEINAALKASNNVLGDIEGIDDSRGVIFEASCGCQWRRDLRGNDSRILDCGEVDCLGIGDWKPQDNENKDLLKRRLTFKSYSRAGEICEKHVLPKFKVVFTEGVGKNKKIVEREFCSFCD